MVFAAFRYSTNPQEVPTQKQFDPALAAKLAPLSRDELVKLAAKFKAQDEAHAQAACREGRAGRGQGRRDRCAQGADRGSSGSQHPARRPRLLRGRNPAAVHRRHARRGGLAARPGARPGVPGHRDAEPGRQGVRRLRAVGRRRPAPRGGRGKADHQERPGRPAAGQAVRRLPGGRVRAPAGGVLHQRLPSTGSGTTPPATRRARSRASTPATSSSC